MRLGTYALHLHGTTLNQTTLVKLVLSLRSLAVVVNCQLPSLRLPNHYLLLTSTFTGFGHTITTRCQGVHRDFSTRANATRNQSRGQSPFEPINGSIAPQFNLSGPIEQSQRLSGQLAVPAVAATRPRTPPDLRRAVLELFWFPHDSSTTSSPLKKLLAKIGNIQFNHDYLQGRDFR